MIVPALLLLSTLVPGEGATASASLGPLCMSVEELRGSWRALSDELRRRNGPTAEGRTHEQLVARFDGSRIELAVDGAWVAPKDLSGSAHELSYAFRSEGSAVSEVSWYLGHAVRLLIVKGETAETAQRGLEGCVRDLSRHQRGFGGTHAI